MPGFKEDVTVFINALGPAASAALARVGHETEDRILSQQTARRGIEPGVREAVDGTIGKSDRRW